MSKFLFHLKFSDTKNYVHEHELYEVMRSRNLYQTQFEVRARFRKRMRNIEISEKTEISGHESRRKLFVQKMKERMEHADKMKEMTDTLKQKAASLVDMYQSRSVVQERRYISLPMASQPQPDHLPDIHKKTQHKETHHNTSPRISDGSTKGKFNNGAKNFQQDLQNPWKGQKHQHQPSTVQPPHHTDASQFLFASPRIKSPINATSRSAPTPITLPSLPAVSSYAGSAAVSKDNSSTKNLTNHPEKSGKVLVAGKRGHTTETIGLPAEKDKPSGKDNDDMIEEETASDTVQKKDVRKNKESSFESAEKYDAVRPLLTSYIHIQEAAPTVGSKLHQTNSDTATVKCAEWTKQHAIITDSNKDLDMKAYKRFLIDRPSKWALSHMSGTALNMMEKRVPYGDSFYFDYKGGGKQADGASQKQLKFNQSPHISLPELDNTPKPMVSMKAGGTTPDGRLILTKADYEAYLSDFKKARHMRLDNAKRKCKVLHKVVQGFQISPELTLKKDNDFILTGSC